MDSMNIHEQSSSQSLHQRHDQRAEVTFTEWLTCIKHLGGSYNGVPLMDGLWTIHLWFGGTPISGNPHMDVGQNPVPPVNLKVDGTYTTWLVGFDPYPYFKWLYLYVAKNKSQSHIGPSKPIFRWHNHSPSEPLPISRIFLPSFMTRGRTCYNSLFHVCEITIYI